MNRKLGRLRSLFVGAVIGLFGAATGAAFATIVGALPYTLTNGSTADATQVMADYNKIITDTNANAAHNGVNSDITALTALSTPITPAQGGTTTYVAGAATGTANAITVASPVPTGMTLANGQTVCFLAGATNTAATTLTANGLTAKNVFRQSPSGVQALTGGEIVSGGLTCAAYDGTQYVLRTSGYLAPGVGPATSLTAAATTDLGTIASHNVTVTGSTGITAFGSTVSATYPVYNLKFTGAPLITYNASSLITPGARDIQAAANDTAVALYLGSGNWQIVSYTVATQPPKLGLATPSAVGLVAVNNTGTPNTKVDITADSAVLTDTNGYGVSTTSASVTINFGTTGANGIDAGSQTSSTWYYTYLIENPAGTVAGLGSLSATAPTMPSGYVYKIRTGAVYSDGSTHFITFRQVGSRAIYTGGSQSVTSTNSLSNTSTSLTTFVPPTAVAAIISLTGGSNGNGGAAASPNANYGTTFTGAATPPYCSSSGAASGQIYTQLCDVPLQTASTLFLTTGTAGTNRVLLNGWLDKVNAS